MLWGAIIAAGSLAYIILSDEQKITPNKEQQYTKSNYDKTLEYFLSLPLGYQEAYVKYNLDLQEIAEELTDNPYLNAHKVARLAEKRGKSYTNINRRY